MATTTKSIHRHKLPTAVLSATLAGDGHTAYVGTMDGVYRLDLESGEHERLYEHQSYVTGVALIEEQALLISAGYDGQLKWYDVNERQVVRHLKAHDFWSWRMATAPNGRYVASVTGQYLAGDYEYAPAPEREPSVRVYRVRDGELLHSLPHVPSVQSVAFSPDSRYLAAGNLMGEVRIWDMESGEQTVAWTTKDFTSWGIIKSHHYLGGIYDMLFSPDGAHILLTGMGPMRDPMAGNGKQTWQRFAWRATPPQKVQEFKGGEGLMETLAFHPVGDCFIMGGRLRGGEWNAAIFANESGAQVHSLKTGFRITKALFNTVGDRLYLAGTQRQPEPKKGVFKPFGRFDVFEFTAS